MGGSVFTAGDQPLNTPRMPPDIYERVKAECFAALRKLYLCVASPIEGPSKKDYGDVDILVAWQRSVFLGRDQSTYAPFTTKQEACQAIQDALGSPFIKMERLTDHYAVHWPRDDTLPQGQGQETSGPASPRYVQIDITICDTVEKMQMKLFKHAHGDLWGILGTIIRPYGLTMDDEALWIRIVEIERLNKNKAKVFLTNDHYEILSFLGMDASDEIWDFPFESLDDMYEYLATCRLFCSLTASTPSSSTSAAFSNSLLHPETSVTLESSASPALALPPTAATLASSSKTSESVLYSPPWTSDPSITAPQNPQSTQQLNSRDKRRLGGRPAYSKFLNEFVPRCLSEGLYTKRSNTIMTVREEAFLRFQGIKETFEKQHSEFLAEKDREVIVAKLKSEWIPAANPEDPKQCHWRGFQVKALKSIIFEGDTSYDGIVPEEPLGDEFGRLNQSKIHQFVMKHMDAVGNIAFEQHQRTYAEHKRE